MTRPLLLDAFCGAGGAAMGYHRAGFDVIGVDIDPQPHYPFPFVRADAIVVLRGEHPDVDVDAFAAFHGSPPCQRYSKSVSRANRERHPDLVGVTRESFAATGRPYVIENVPGAPLVNPVMLCGSSFGLPIRRHRLFELGGFDVMAPPCAHGAYPRRYAPAWNRTTPLRVLSLSGGWTGAVDLDEHRAAMGVDWDVTAHELSEAIPPAYTQHIGDRLHETIITNRAYGTVGGDAEANSSR